MRVTLRWFVAFSLLLLTIHEAHELAHASVGRIVCGEWPSRDFNAWRFTTDCASSLPTAAGPLFSYALMGVGAFLAFGRFRWGGIALVLAANPFARIFTAAMGGGDEVVVARQLAELPQRTFELRLAVLAFVLAICGSALFAVWRAMRDVRRRAAWFPFLAVWPMILTGVALFVVGNRLLRAEVLAAPVIAGAPLLVVLVSGLSAALTIVAGGWLVSRAESPASS